MYVLLLPLLTDPDLDRVPTAQPHGSSLARLIPNKTQLTSFYRNGDSKYALNNE